MKMKVDKELLPMKAHYFLFNAGTAPVVPFMPTLARQLGFSTVVVGMMYTVLPVVGMLAKPLFGFVADRYRRHRTLFLAAEILTAVAFFLIMFIPPIPQPPPAIEFHCHAGAADVRYCSASDKCIENNLQKHYGNETIACALHCHAQPSMWEVICEDWLKINQSTAGMPPPPPAGCSDHTLPYFDLNTRLAAAAIVREEQCLFFPIAHIHAEFAGRNVTMFCPKDKPYFKANCTIDCGDATYLRSELTPAPSIGNREAFGLYQFWALFVLLIFSWIGMAVVVSIGDAICFSILGERHHLYGKQRLCGSIGWGTFSIIAGILVDKMSGGSATKDYTAVFWMTLIIIAFDVLASTKLKHTQTHLSANIVKDVGSMFRSLRCCIFFLWCITIGLCTALVWNYLFWYLEELGTATEGCDNSMKTLQGIVMGIQCFGGELPFFFLSGWILRKLGHVNVMSLVLFGFGVRFILYSMLEDPWYVLPIELLNGITFGLFYATMASYASIVAPPGTEATLQGLVGAIFEGIGVAVGSLIGGILYDAVGGGHTFAIYGALAFVAFVAHVCVQLWLKRNGSGSPIGTQNGTVRYLAPSDAMHMLNEQEYSIVS